MRQLTNRITRAVVAAAFAFLPFLSVPIAHAAADSCTWTGATSANWNDASNWSGCDNGNLPEDGDTLVFPIGASNKVMNNDFGTIEPQFLTFTGSGYSLGGNDFTLSGGSHGITANQNVSIGVSITFNGTNANNSVSTGATVTFNNDLVLMTTGGFYWDGGGDVVFNSDITGDAGTMFRAENGTVATLNGTANTYTSTRVGTESDANFVCNDATCFGNSGNIIYSGGGIVSLSASASISNDIETSVSTPDDSIIRAYNNISMMGTLTVNDDLLIDQQGAGAYSVQFLGSITLNGDLDTRGINSADSTVRLNANIGGLGNITSDNVFLELTGANTYSGDTTVGANAIVSVENDTALGDNTGDTSVQDGGQLLFDFASPSSPIDEDIHVLGTGPSSSGALRFINSTRTISGTITLDGDATFVAVDGSDTYLSGVIAGTGDLTLTSEVLEGANFYMTGTSANTYSGTLTLDGVYLELGKTAGQQAITGDVTAIGRSFGHGQIIVTANNMIADTAIVDLQPIANQANLVLYSDISETIGAVVGSGLVMISDGATLTTTSNSGFAFDGTLVRHSLGDTDPSTFAYTGTGTASLTGTVFDQGEGFPVLSATNGTISFDPADTSFSMVPTTITNGVVKGTGIIGQLSLVNSDVTPGMSPGCLYPAGSVTFDSGSSLGVEISSATACSGYDVLNASGAVNLNNATLSVTSSYTPSAGAVFTIVHGSSISGTFTGLADGAIVTSGGVTYRVNYTSTTVTLSYVSGVATSPASNLSDTGTSLYASFVAVLLTLLALGATRLNRKTK